MPKRLAVALLFLTVAACAANVGAVRTTHGFSLSELRSQPVAVWPIPAVKIDEVYRKTVIKAHGSSDQFIDVLADKISARLAQESKASVLSSHELVAALSRSDATRPLLDSDKLLGPESDNRFASATPVDLTPLAAVAELGAVRYLVLPRDARVIWLFTPGEGAKPGSWNVHVKLRLVVMDWKDRAVVWDGWVHGRAAPFTYATPTGELKRAEDALAKNLVDAMKSSSNR